MLGSDFKRWLLVLGAALLAWLVYKLQPILMPFLVGALLAYMGNPLVLRLTRLGMRRTWAVSLAFLVLCLGIVLGLVLLLPSLWRQVLYLESKVPALLNWINREGLPWVAQHLHIKLPALDMDLVLGWLASYWQEAGAAAQNLLPHVAQSGLNLLGTLGLLSLIPVVAFYLLLDWETLMQRIRALIPRDMEPTVSRLASECDDVLAAFFRGQLMVMVALGVIYAVGLQLVGLKLAIIIGLMAGLASIIPYLGFAVGIVSATVAALFQFGLGFEVILQVWAVFLVGQMLEGMVLQPFLLGDRIGLHPVAVIFAVMAGGTLFGFFGMLLALPVAAVIMVLLRHVHSGYINSDLYRQHEGVSAVEGDDGAR